MRVCIIGHFNDNIQEGVRNVSKEIAKTLDKKCITVFRVNISMILPWKKINDFHPEIIHFVISPTIGGLVIAKITSYFCRDAKIVISAIHNSLSKNHFFLKYLAPDLMLVQSKESELFFKSLDFPVETVLNGVDVIKFQPINLDQKIILRKQMNFKTDDFILLHLASFTTQRNLSVLSDIIQRERCEILIIGRDHEKVDPTLIDNLKKSGCRIEIKNFENIEEIYNIADCYIFPTNNKSACIETPLSVIEAMSCNLPIISTRFGALPLIFNNSKHGFYFFDNEEDCIKIIKILKQKNNIISTREQVLDLSWENLGEIFIKKYQTLIQSRKSNCSTD